MATYYMKSEKVYGDLLNHFLNRDFNDLHDFQKTTKKDQNSIYILIDYKTVIIH